MKQRTRGKPATDLLEEAVDLLRRCGLVTWLCYYVGSVPFILAFLYFWSEMSAGAYAEQTLPTAALGMAAALVWMRSWQSVFAHRLLALAGTPPSPPWTPGRVARLAVQQAFVQSSALFVLPVAALLTVPYGWTLAFYQHFHVDGCGEKLPVRRLIARSAAHARLWPEQNHIGIGFLLLLTAVVYLNALSLLWAVPHLAKTLLGIETVFTRNHLSLLNSTVLLIAAGITYLVIAPLSQAFYVLRGFYGQAVRTGADLKAALRRFRSAAVCILGALVCFAGQPAARAVESKQLDQSIRKVLASPEFAWRMPREPAEASAETPALFQKFTGAVGAALKKCVAPLKKLAKKLIRWFEKYLETRQPASEKPALTTWKNAFEWTLYLLCALLAVAALLVMRRAWNRRRSAPRIDAEPVRAVPDLRSEQVTADQLPEDRWIALAEELAGQGEFRLSLRALYLAGLAHLGARELVTIARAKSNCEFGRELGRRARSRPGLIDAFAQSVRTYERVWYGTAEATRETVADYGVNLERLRAC